MNFLTQIKSYESTEEKNGGPSNIEQKKLERHKSDDVDLCNTIKLKEKSKSVEVFLIEDMSHRMNSDKWLFGQRLKSWKYRDETRRHEECKKLFKLNQSSEEMRENEHGQRSNKKAMGQCAKSDARTFWSVTSSQRFTCSGHTQQALSRLQPEECRNLEENHASEREQQLSCTGQLKLEAEKQEAGDSFKAAEENNQEK